MWSAIEVDAHLLPARGPGHVEALLRYQAYAAGACRRSASMEGDDLVDAVVVLGQGDVLPGGVRQGLGLSFLLASPR